MTVRVVTGSMMIVAITPHHKLYTQEEFKNALTPARYVSEFTNSISVNLIYDIVQRFPFQIFASFDQCNFFTFSINSQAHDNCLLFNNDAKTYLETCPVYAQPLYDADGNELMEVVHCKINGKFSISF